jgi:hypothetical protein
MSRLSIDEDSAIVLVTALELLPDKKLISDIFCDNAGGYCAAGAILKLDGILDEQMTSIDYADHLSLAVMDKITEFNDLLGKAESEEARYGRVYNAALEAAGMDSLNV